MAMDSGSPPCSPQTPILSDGRVLRPRSTARRTSVLELAKLVWRSVNGLELPFRVVSDPPFEYDVQYRVPDVTKAKDRLGFVSEVTLEDAVDEVVHWCRREIEAGRL